MKKYKVAGPNKKVLLKKVSQKFKVNVDEIGYEILEENEKKTILNVWLKKKDKKTAPKKTDEKDLINIDVKEEGVFLTLKPGKIKMDTIINVISKREIESPEMSEIQKAYDNRDKEYKIGEYYGDLYKKSEVEVIIAKDKMKAFVKFSKPVGMGPPGMKEIKDKLEENGVSFGFKINNIKEAIQKNIYDEEITAAEGQPAVNGDNAYISYKIKVVDKKKGLKPAVLENGKVDFKNLEIVENVKKDQVLAEKIPATQGKTGKDVLGKELPAKDGKEAVLYGGKNTELIENDTKIISQIDGMVSVDNKKIVVSKVFETPVVGLATGNIDFIGSVNVNGDVMSDHKVKAEGNITIKGNVENAELISKNDIIIKGSLFGKEKAKIESENDVIINFAEAANIEAGNNVIANEAIMGCKVNAGKKVRVIDNKGVILGGTIKAGEGVEAIDIGSHLAIKTSIEVGSNPKLIKEIRELEDTLKELKKKKSQIDKNVLLLNNLKSKMGDAMPDDKKQLLIQMTNAQYSLETEINVTQDSIEFKNTEMNEIKNATVDVYGTCYPGVKIKIRKGTYFVEEKMQNVKFYYENAEIKFTALK